MPPLKSYGVFISHAWDYDTDYYRVESMLNNAKRFKWRNCSVPQHDPLQAANDSQLEEALRNQIRPANVVVIISGMYINNRKWIQKEIDIALEMNKPIIGLVPRGAQRIPTEIRNIAPMVGWQTASIVDAIRNPPKPQAIQPSYEAEEVDIGWTGDQTAITDFSDLDDFLHQPDTDEPRISIPARRAIKRTGMTG